MGKKLLTALFISLLAPEAKAQSEVCEGDVCIVDRTTIGGETIPLRGIHKFTYMFFDVYTLALYAPRDVTSVLNNVPKKLVFNYHRDITKQQMVKGANENLRDNPNIDITEFSEKLLKINSWYQDVSDGDRYELIYVPERGTELVFNGQSKGIVRGVGFQRMYFGIWLSEHPLSKSLRDRVLGK